MTGVGDAVNGASDTLTHTRRESATKKQYVIKTPSALATFLLSPHN